MADSKEWRQLSDVQRAAIQEHQNNNHVPVGAIAKSLGISVRLSNIGPSNSGQILRNPDGDGYLIRVNRYEAKYRQRFTIAHALSHFLLHQKFIDRAPEGIIDNVLYRSAAPRQIENEANSLAGDILMPHVSVQQKMRALGGLVSERTIETLAREFKVTTPVMAIRLQNIAV